MGLLQRTSPLSVPLAALLAALLAVPAAAAAPEPRIEASTSKTAITVGDTITYRVRVVAGGGSTVLMPRPPARLGDFEVLGHRRLQSRPLGDEGTVWTDEYLLAAYAPGERAVAAPPVTVIESAGDTARLACDTTRVTVASVLGDGDQELRDIKGPATVPGRRAVPGLALGAAAAAVALCLALILWRRRRRALGAVSVAPPPADVAALERLEQLLSAGLLEKGRLREYYVELSEALRRYLDQRYLVPAPELTTAELAERLEYLGLPSDIRGEACDLLLESDMVKFAKYKPEVGTAFEAAKRARRLIARSSPRRGAAGQGAS